MVIVTSFFPNSLDRNRTIFVKNLALAMRERCNLSVVAPIPYAPPLPFLSRWTARRKVAASEVIDGIVVLHPRFVVVPKFNVLSGITYCLGVLGVLRRLKRTMGPFVVHGHCAYPDGVGLALAARALRLPFVITAHGSDVNVYAEKAWLRPQIRWALRSASAVVAVSEALAAKIGQLTSGGVARLKFIPCAGFDSTVFFPRPRAETRSGLGLQTNGRLAVYVGHLVPIKGVDWLVDAWSQLRREGRVGDLDRLVLVGDGPMRTALARRAEAAVADSGILFVGVLPQAEVSRWIAAADILCLPSLNEGTPNVVVEAFACGTPVVATRVGGVPALVREGENGLLVEPRDGAALAQAIDRALHASWDTTSIQRSVSHLTWRALAEQNVELLRSLPNVCAGACSAPGHTARPVAPLSRGEQ